MNSLNMTMNHVADVIENVFHLSTLPPTPVWLQDAMACAMKLEKNWLTPMQLAKLIDAFKHKPAAAVAYQSMKDAKDL